jgi:predicted dehydrogenase
MEGSLKRHHPAKKQVILVGRGSMGRIYEELCTERKIEIVAIVKSSAALKDALAVHTDAAVIIASPSNVHQEQVDLCEPHRRILLEKPFAMSHAGAKAVQPRVSVSGFQRRLDNHFQSAFSQLHMLGELQLIRVISRDPPSSSRRSTSCLVWNSQIHDFDMCCWMAKSRPLEVHSQLAGDGTFLSSTIVFQNGCIALCVYNQGISYGYDQRIELHGSKSSIFVSNPVASATMVATSERTTQRPPLCDGYASRYRQAYAKELDALFDPNFRVSNHEDAHWCCEQAMRSLEHPSVVFPAPTFPLANDVLASRHGGKIDEVARVALVGCGRMGEKRGRFIILFYYCLSKGLCEPSLSMTIRD